MNKPWANLTETDIRRVYDGLEDGTIRNARGKRFEDRRGYYNKILKSKPFQLAGKVDLVRNVIEFSTQERKEVRFVPEDTFRAIVSVVSKPRHLLLLWLAWDIGENINALLKLTRNDFVRQKNPYTSEPEYLVHLPQAKIKRSRRTRSEPNLYPETVHFADIVLQDLQLQEPVFKFGYRQAWKMLRAAVIRSKAMSAPNNDLVRWKDLRSGMACHLLRSGWSCDEVNARLGHAPHSKELDTYINFLAIDRGKPKKKLFDSSLNDLQMQLQETLRREKLTRMRLQHQENNNSIVSRELARTRSDLCELRLTVEGLMLGINAGKIPSSSVEST